MFIITAAYINPHTFVMKFIIAIFLLVGIVVAKKTKRLKDNLFTDAAKYKIVKAALVCKISVECVVTKEISKKSKHHFECSPVYNGTVSDYTYLIDLPSHIIEHHREELTAGDLFVNIPGGNIVGDSVHVPKDSKVAFVAPPLHFTSRNLQQGVTGTRSVLVLRVTTNDATVVYSSQDIYNYVFDNSQTHTQPSLRSQYGKLSFGKLTFVPAQQGVLDVYVNMNANGGSVSGIRDAAISAATSQFQVSSITSLADHIIICVPPGTGNWAGSATVSGWRIVLNNDWCGYLSGQMHEMGHNLGLLVSLLFNYFVLFC